MKCAPVKKPEGNTARTCRVGPKMRNPYLNFCRDFRKKHFHEYDAREIIKRAALAWQKLPDQDKTKYIVDAFYTRKNSTKRRSSRRKC